MNVPIHSRNSSVIFTDNEGNINYFIKTVLPKGVNLVHFNKICCPLSLQDGFSFKTGNFHNKPENCKEICPLKRGVLPQGGFSRGGPLYQLITLACSI